MSTEAYAGDIDSRQAIEVLRNNARSVLIDVRSEAEWDFVGRPNLNGLANQALFIPWQRYPGMRRNEQFSEQVRESGVGKDDPLLLLCRSGNRSRHAAIALTARGYRHCFNISDGFEGPADAAGHRNAVSGWRANGLPWCQG